MRASLALAQVVAAGAFGLTACATTSRSMDSLTDARATIRAAEEMGVEDVPSASTVLAVARQAEDHGARLIQGGQNRRAPFVLERAQADAALAISLARETPLRAEAARAQEQLRRQQEELEQREEVSP